MIKVIIVDDEKNVLELIEYKLLEMNNVEVIGKFINPVKAYEEIVIKKPDLVITDVEMPGLSGVELAKKISLKYQDIKFVFLTAYKEYAFDAFKVNALHYIMKPVSKKDLEEIYVRIEKNQINTKDNKELNKIITFGDFSVINYNQKRVKFPTLKVEELFALLIMNKDSGVGKWNLINELWDISEIKNPLQNLYTTIYRLRKTFEKYNLPFKIRKANDNYKINIENTFFDYHQFKKSFENLKDSTITEKNISNFKRLVDLYVGNLFMYKDYIWCIYERNALQNNYSLILKKLKNFYESNNKKEELDLIEKHIKDNNI